MNQTILAGKAVVEKIASAENPGDVNTKRQRGPKYSKLLDIIAPE